MTPQSRRSLTPPVTLAALTLGLLVVATFGPHLIAQSTVTIVGVAAGHSSVRITFRPVPGAKDYRVYDVANPNSVKYAGQAHLSPAPNCPGLYCLSHFVLQSDGVTPVYPFQVASGGSGGPQVLDIAAPQIDWNNVGDGGAHTLIVEAVDALGPVPKANLYSGDNDTPLVNPLPSGAMLGANKGPTLDGKVSTNGQGPYTNTPHVIASSQPFIVQANRNYTAIPSKPGATQTFFDTFENAESAALTFVTRNDTYSDGEYGNLGLMKYTLNAGTSKAWELEYRRSDNLNSMPMIMSDHFMDILFDGATPGVSAPTHTIYGSMAMTPTQTVSMSGGKMLHLTMEVDAHQSFRRWMDFNIAPASDPLRAWHPATEPINVANQGIFLEIRDGECTLDIYTGSISASDRTPTGSAGGSAHGARLWGQPGSSGGAPIMCGWDEMYIPRNLGKNGAGLDDKSRYDFFLSQTHAALFQDGRLIVESDIPAGSFPWANVPLKTYYTHYMYHSNVDIEDLSSFSVSGQNFCYPMNSFWFNNPLTGTPAASTICNTVYPAGYGFPYSDERHWDNMGYEVLAGSDVPSGSYASLSSLVQPPPALPPNTSGVAAPAPPSNVRIVP